MVMMDFLCVNYFHEQEQLEKEVFKNVINVSFCLLHYHAFIKQQHFDQLHSWLRIIKVWLNFMRIILLEIFSYLRITQYFSGDYVMIFIHQNDDFLHVNVFVNVNIHEYHYD